MFSIQTFVDECRGALQSDDPAGSVAGVFRDALQDRAEVAAAVNAWKAGGGGAYGAIYRARDLTILHAAVTPGFESPRHNHTMWAVIGVFEGQEDNTFYRRGEQGIEEVSRTSICAGDAQVLPADVIHRIANYSLHALAGDPCVWRRSARHRAGDVGRRHGRGASIRFRRSPIQAMSN